MAYILVIDTGSSSMRGILFAGDGTMAFTHRRQYTMQTRGHAAEYRPADFEDCLLSVCSACARFAASENQRIDALSFTSQRSSILPIAADGTPLAPIITWYDKRSAGICDAINAAHGAEVYSIAGMLAAPVLSAPKMLWLQRSHPDIYQSAHKIIGIQDYLLYLCTGRFVTDSSLASRTSLMDARTRAWSHALLSLYNIKEEKLAELVPPCTVVGPVSPGFALAAGLTAGIPVVTAGGDQQCSVLGQGLLRPGAAGVTCGSGAYLAAITDVPVFDARMRVNVNAAVSPGQWVLEASTLSSGTVQDWMNRAFYPDGSEQTHPLQQLHKEAQQSPVGAKGVLMLPDLAGKGCPDWDSYARGCFCNISFDAGRGDFARAMLEGLCAEIAECHDVLRELIPQAGTISATGGLTRLPLFNQIMSDMIDFPIKWCNNEETTAIGAYLAAVWTLGRFSSLEEAYLALPASYTGTTEYHPIARHTALYRQINRIRRILYDAIPAKELSRLSEIVH